VVLGGIWNEENTECRTQNIEENGEDGRNGEFRIKN